jgi:hypothetical protein
MILFAIHMLEGMFIVGALGSVLVLILSAIDDVRVLLGRDADKQ